MHLRALLFAATALSLAAAPLAAQQTLAVGASVTGTLAPEDPRMPGADTPYDAYLLQGRPGQRVGVGLRAVEFDPILYAGPASGPWRELARNDDSGTGAHSFLVVTLDAAGRAVIRAAALASGPGGRYTLSARSYAEPMPTPIAVGESRFGVLMAKSFQAGNGPEDRYVIRGAPGTRVTVSVSSIAFDTYVAVGTPGPEGWNMVEEDDDGGGGTNARVVVTLPASAAYHVAVHSFDGEGTGRYTISVDEGGVGGSGARREDFSGTGRAGAEVSAGGRVDADFSGTSQTQGVPSVDPRSPRIQAGATVEGVLERGDREEGLSGYFDDYLITGRAGENLDIRLTSTEFDAELHLGRARETRFSALADDDDSGGGRNARILFVLPEAGTYVIRVTSRGGAAAGPYTLTVQRRN